MLSLYIIVWQKNLHLMQCRRLNVFNKSITLIFFNQFRPTNIINLTEKIILSCNPDIQACKVISKITYTCVYIQFKVVPHCCYTMYYIVANRWKTFWKKFCKSVLFVFSNCNFRKICVEGQFGPDTQTIFPHNDFTWKITQSEWLITFFVNWFVIINY